MSKRKAKKCAANGSKFDGGLLGMIGTGILSGLAALAATAIGVLVLVVCASASNVNFDNLEALTISPLLIVGIVVLALCVFFGAAWASVISFRWSTRHTVIGGKRLRFDGTAWQLFWTELKWLFFTVITIGIYGLWLPIKAAKWQTKHTVFEDGTCVPANDNNGNFATPYGQFTAQPPVMPQQPVMQQPVMPTFGYPYAPYGMPQNEQNNKR